MDFKRFALLPMVPIIFTACHFTKPDPEFDKYLNKTVSDFNLIARSEPGTKERKLLVAKSGPGRRITFSFKINIFTAADIKTPKLNQYSDSLRNELPKKLNKTELFQNLSKNRVVLIYDYAGSDGAALFSIKLVPSPGQGYVPA